MATGRYSFNGRTSADRYGDRLTAPKHHHREGVCRIATRALPPTPTTAKTWMTKCIRDGRKTKPSHLPARGTIWPIYRPPTLLHWTNLLRNHTHIQLALLVAGRIGTASATAARSYDWRSGCCCRGVARLISRYGPQRGRRSAGMEIGKRKELFNVAYVCALAAQAGLNYESLFVDDDSVDITLLKCTSGHYLSGEVIKFPLKKKNYDDLRGENVVSPATSRFYWYPRPRRTGCTITTGTSRFTTAATGPQFGTPLTAPTRRRSWWRCRLPSV
ncbi:hypothetical protein Ddc_19045 [Ditylenchus destructor]|nr:hypothetical protein Ddc_19045 [Ditylenchus destructor]